MSLVLRTCEQCKKTFEIERGQVNAGRGRFCSLQCSAARRKLASEELARRQKERRQRYWQIPENAARRKIMTRASHLRRYNPEKARALRLAQRDQILEYQRTYYARPEIKAEKARYDRSWRCQKRYGEFWEAASLLIDLDKEIETRMPDQLVRQAKGTCNKSQRRRRAYEVLKRQKFEGDALGNAELGQGGLDGTCASGLSSRTSAGDSAHH